MEKCVTESRRERRRKGGATGSWGGWVPPFSVEQEHLESFTSALTETMVQIQQLHHPQFHTFPAPTTETQRQKNFSARAKKKQTSVSVNLNTQHEFCVHAKKNKHVYRYGRLFMRYKTQADLFVHFCTVVHRHPPAQNPPHPQPL